MVIGLQMFGEVSTGENAFDALHPLMSEVLRLNAEVFQFIPTLPYSLPAALLVVFIAGFFQSLSQIVVLFINQVRPSRFVLSLLISALFFVIGYGFWALSTWTILAFVFNAPLSFLEMLRTLGFSYAPLAMFGVFVILPYFGGGVFVLLSTWTLLAVVVGIESLSALSRWDAFASAMLGWVVFQLLQKTVGQPIASLGQWITNWAAGEELITNRLRLAEELYTGLRWQPPAERAAQRDSEQPMSVEQRYLGYRNGYRNLAQKAALRYRDRRRSRHRSHPKSLSQAILSQSLQDARERLRAENREHDR